MGFPFEDQWQLAALGGARGADARLFPERVHSPVADGRIGGQPPSHCPGCGTQIRWYDNIPVLSYLILRGKCRVCRASISPQYPIVELATGLIWAGSFMQLRPLRRERSGSSVPDHSPGNRHHRRPVLHHSGSVLPGRRAHGLGLRSLSRGAHPPGSALWVPAWGSDSSGWWPSSGPGSSRRTPWGAGI